MSGNLNLKSFDKKQTTSLRTSPLYFECRCKEIENIKKNLHIALETITQLREENCKTREMLKIEYQDKITTLESENVYLKYLLKKNQSKETSTKLMAQVERLQQNCQNKDKIIEIQEKKLNEISQSVKLQVKDFKNIVELNLSLENELKKTKKLESSEIFHVFNDFYHFSKSLGNKILYKTVKSCLGSSREVLKDLKKHKCIKIMKRLLKLCGKLMKFIDFNKTFNLPADEISDIEENFQSKLSNSIRCYGQNSSTSHELASKLPTSTSLSSSTRIPKISTLSEVHKEPKINSTQETRSYTADKSQADPHSHSSSLSLSRKTSLTSEVKEKLPSPEAPSASPKNSHSEARPSGSEGKASLPSAKASKPGKAEAEAVHAEPSPSKFLLTAAKQIAKEEIPSIAEEIPIFPKDYSSLFQEGEHLLKLIDNQNSRLSKLSKVMTESYEPSLPGVSEDQPVPSEESQEISSRHSVEDNPGNVETFQRKRSRWNTNTNNSPAPNLRIPFGLNEDEKGLDDALDAVDQEVSYKRNGWQDRSWNKNLPNLDKSEFDDRKSETRGLKVNVRRSKSPKKSPRNSPLLTRFQEYVRPNMKSEKNWESVEEFFNAD